MPRTSDPVSGDSRPRERGRGVDARARHAAAVGQSGHIVSTASGQSRSAPDVLMRGKPRPRESRWLCSGLAKYGRAGATLAALNAVEPERDAALAAKC